MKAKTLAISTIVLIVLIVAGATMAWFTAGSPTIANKFNMGSVEVEVVEEFQEVNDVTIGVNYDKKVWVESRGTKNTYVRVRLVPEWSSNPSLPVSNVELIFADDIDQYWEDNTGVNGDGYFYYKYYLTTGKPVTSLLLKGVKFNNLVGYEDATFTLKVVAEGVQITHDAYQDVWGFDELPFTVLGPNPYPLP